MAKTAKNKTDEESVETSPSLDLKIVVNSVFKKFQEKHFNDIETPIYKVSSGSLNLDAKLGGGIGPSLVRFTGPSEAGKSSLALTFLSNFLKDNPKGRGVYIDSECRLNEKLKSRYNIKFVYKPEEFETGTCLVLVTNSYNMAISLMRDLVTTNKGTENRFFFIIDSVDKLVPDDTIEMNAEDVHNVAGMQKAMFTTRFLERFSTAMRKCGHISIFISQIRTKMVPMGQKPHPNDNVVNSSGANILNHDADWILEFQTHLNKNTQIIEDVNGKPSIVGHLCRILFRKTQNDTTNELIEYPIRRNAPIGKAVWTEKEIFDRLLSFGKIIKKGAWMTIDNTIIKLLADNNITIDNQFQGEAKFSKFLEENPEASKILYNHVLEIEQSLLEN